MTEADQRDQGVKIPLANRGRPHMTGRGLAPLFLGVGKVTTSVFSPNLQSAKKKVADVRNAAGSMKIIL
jgi:hypothetical protein